MGHITRIKINHQVGRLPQVSELEGSIDALELTDVLNAVNNRTSLKEWQETAEVPRSSVDMDAGHSPRSIFDGGGMEPTANETFRDRVIKVAVALGFDHDAKEKELVLRSNAALDWLCEWSNGDSQNKPAEDWRKRFELSEAMVNATFEVLAAARGAVRILGTAVGIESGNDCNVAKLAKQVHGRVGSMSTQYWSMDGELDNLRGAMSRIQMPDVPPRVDDMELPKQCQTLAHHMDVLKRTGFAVVPEEAKPGVHVHGPQTREERFERLKVAQQEATRMMIDLATIDGYVTKDTPADEVMAKTMSWSIDIDNKRKAEEGVKKGSPTTGEPQVGLTTVTQNHQPGIDVKINIKNPEDPGVEGVGESVAQLIGLQVKGALEEIEKDLKEIDKSELEGGEDASEVD